MDILVVVDMQTDFIDGSLGTPEAVKILPNVIKKINSFTGKVFFTRDTHDNNYLDTAEGKKLPIKHCIKGSPGWQLHPEIAKLCKDEPIDKPTFGSVKLAEKLVDLNSTDKISSITLIGLCTDICVISNALLLKAYFPDIPIIIDSSCCAGVTPQSHLRALEAMKCCQIEIK
jgi:hypothetical protein